MEFTNNQELPLELHKFLTYNDYAMGGERFNISATKLMDSPQIAGFWKSHGKEVVEDSATRLYSSMGSGIHGRYEQANASNAEVLMEKRFLREFSHPVAGEEPLVLSGQIDSYNFRTKTLADLKNVSAWKLVKKDYSSFEKQLNIGAYLMGRNGFEIEKLQIYALVRDWSRARQSERDYPMQPIEIIDIPLWSEEEQEEYIRERLELHFGEGPKECSDEERWKRASSFAVKKKSAKRALRVLPTLEKAESWIASQGLEEGKGGVFIEERPATYARCADYCAFSKLGVCEQFNNSKEV